ncbi:hypothetical protein RNZ50_02985 [Paracoccaceae bacterium Fryx2]|nr:hypothetical protein [Paracoccaceae bacterium Fryx2]
MLTKKFLLSASVAASMAVATAPAQAVPLPTFVELFEVNGLTTPDLFQIQAKKGKKGKKWDRDDDEDNGRDDDDDNGRNDDDDNGRDDDDD